MYVLHVVSRVLFYWIPNYLLHVAGKKGWGTQWKIQGSKMPRRQLKTEALLDNVWTDSIPQLFVSFTAHMFMTLGQKRLDAKEEEKRHESPSHEISECRSKVPVGQQTADTSSLGWVGLRFSGQIPSLRTHFWQVTLAYFGYDMLFYWSHRLMHHKNLYKHCHKIHHQFHTPIGPASSHHHPIEGVIQTFNWYLPIAFAGFLNRHSGGLHIATLFYYHCFRWIETVDAHCGYEFPFSPFHLLPIFGGARMHDYHHRAFDGCYGASMIWDRLCGTDKGFWQEVWDEGGFLVGGKRVPALRRSH